MGPERFGGSRFQIVVQDFDRSDPVGDSQLFLTLEGPGWRLGGESAESFGVVVPKLIAFGRNGASRHWGSFAGMQTPDEVMNRLVDYVFPPGIEPSGPWHWDTSSALFEYVLSARFDGNLGVRCVAAVRGQKNETIIIQADDGDVQAHEVSVGSFDRAISELSKWARAVELGESQ